MIIGIIEATQSGTGEYIGGYWAGIRYRVVTCWTLRAMPPRLTIFESRGASLEEITA